MPPVRLVASDLDGTLLAPGGRLTERTVAALAAAAAAGIHVVPATGRSWRTALPRLAPAPGLRWLVCSNGALLYDRDAGSVSAHHPIAATSLPRVVASLRAGLPDVSFGWEVPAGWGWEAAFLAQGGPADADHDVVVERLGTPWPEGVTKLFVGHPDLELHGLLAVIEPLLVDGLVASSSGALFVEVTGTGVDKAFGVAHLCGRLGIDRSEVVALGDHLNDVSLLRWAGRGVAMGNADASALAVAGERTASNADDGAARVIEQLVTEAAPAGG
jgi:hydroxymethylpyrimidine pyrophosphatase-like HAD family hydrolase